MASHEGFGYDNRIAEEEDLLAFGVRRSLQLTHGIEYITNILGDSYGGDFAWHYPTGQRKIIEAFPHIFADEREALMKYTRLPFYQRFIGVDVERAYLQHHLTESIHGINKLLCSGHFAGKMAVCTLCSEERKSFLIWDRLFLLPGIFSCDKHHVELRSLCPQCYRIPLMMHGWRPPQKCICPRGLQPVARLDEKSMHISNFVSILSRKFLRNNVHESLNKKSIMAAIFRHIPDSSHSRPSMLKAIAFEAGGDNFFVNYQFSDNTFKRFAKDESDPFRNPIQILAMAAVFFKTPECLLQAANTEERVVDANPKSPVANSLLRRGRRSLNTCASNEKIPTQDMQTRLQECRRNAKRLLKEHQPLTRTEVWRIPLMHRYISFLSKNDPEWLEKQLPARKAKSSSSLEDESSRRSLISSVYETRAALLSATPSMFINLARLFADTKYKRTYRQLLRFPDIKAAIDDCSDTEEKYQLRVASIFVEEIQKVAPQSRFANVGRYFSNTRKNFRQKMRWAKLRVEKEIS